ncbi:MAG: AraC family transcriptional regulator [Sulfuricellaceae bacterium]|nr:AraC family transcriptional regulator [Sulfuricellaceae bacterium]
MKKQWLPFLLAFVLPLILIFWWWGGFSQARFETTQRGPYRYAYLTQQGDYAKLPEKQQEALTRLQQQNVKTGTPIALLMSDPRESAKRDRMARVGYLVEEGVQVEAPLAIDTIPARQVLLVEVKAQLLLAPGKAYSALIDYLDDKQMQLKLPTVELYRDGVLSVEMNI